MRAAILLLFLAHVALASPSSREADPHADVPGFKLGSVAVPDFLNREKQATVTFGDLRKERPTVIRLPSADTRPIRGLPRASTGLPASGPPSLHVEGARELWEGRSGPSRTTSQQTRPPRPSSLREAKSSPASSTAGSVPADDAYQVALSDFNTIVDLVTRKLRSPTSKAKEWALMTREESFEAAVSRKLQSARNHFAAMAEQAVELMSSWDAESERGAFAAYLTELIRFLRDMELAQMGLKKASSFSVQRFTNLESARERYERFTAPGISKIATFTVLLPRLMWDTFGIEVVLGRNLFTQLANQMNKMAGWV